MATICILSGITINLINRSYYQTTDIWSILNSLITEPRQYGSWPHVNPSTVSESVVQSMTLSLPLLARSQHPLCERRHKPMSGVPIPASWQVKNKLKHKDSAITQINSSLAFISRELYVRSTFLWELWVILEVINSDRSLYWWNMGITEKSAEVPPGDAYTVGHDTRRGKRRGVIVKVYQFLQSQETDWSMKPD